MELSKRVLNILIAFDQLLYVLLTLGSGMPDETMSSAAWRAELDGRPARVFRPLIDALFFFEKDHCRNAYESEVLRRHVPDSYKTQPDQGKT